MNVHDSSARNRGRNLLAEYFPSLIPVQPVDAMNDLRSGLRKAAGKRFGQIQVLGRASAAPLAQHALDSPIARPPVVDRAHRFYQFEERAIALCQGVHNCQSVDSLRSASL